MSVISRPACSTVWSIPELLEIILSFLPAKTIFSVQRVSHSWKNTIAQSVAIQEKLFLRCQGKPQQVWELHNKKHWLAVRLFCCQNEHLRKEGRVSLDTFYKYAERGSYDYFTLSRLYGRHCIQLRRTEQTENDHDLILPVSLNPALKVPISTLEPMRIHQRRPFFKVNRRGMFLNLPLCDLRQDAYEVFQLVQYTGTLATLENIAGMYLSDPPCQHAMMHVDFYCRTIEGSPKPARIFVRLCQMFFESSTGLKMGDLLKALSHAPCSSYGLVESPHEYFREDNRRRLGPGPGWDDHLTVLQLRSVLQEHYQSMHLFVSPALDIKIRLLDDTGALRPIVPTAAERSAVVDK